MFLGSGGLTCQDKQYIVDLHNQMRSSVASGRIAGQPAAADMKEMVCFLFFFKLRKFINVIIAEPYIMYNGKVLTKFSTKSVSVRNLLLLYSDRH